MHEPYWKEKWNKDREDTKLLTLPVPWNNIHIRVVCLKRGCRRLPWTNVPYCDIPIHRTGGKYMRFCRTPLHKFKFKRSCQNFLFEGNVIGKEMWSFRIKVYLQIFNASRMSNKWSSIDIPRSARWRLPQMNKIFTIPLQKWTKVSV